MSTGIEPWIHDIADSRSAFRLPGAIEADLKAVYRDMHPYDIGMRARWADALYEKHESVFPEGSPGRAPFLLTLLHYLYPAKRLSHAYFNTLRAQLGERIPLEHEGRVVLGVGPGRCGSTSLSSAFAAAGGALATHETPPMIFWQPQREQVEFHMQRLALLAKYFPLVFDASHWWLNVLDAFFEQFPRGKVVGLYRDMESCVMSFLKIKGVEAGSYNHWAPPDDPMWTPNYWDPTYPSFEAPDKFRSDPFRCKGTQIQWYVDLYNSRLRELASTHPDRVLLVRTEALADPHTDERLSAFAGTRIALPAERINSSVMTSIEQGHSLWF